MIQLNTSVSNTSLFGAQDQSGSVPASSGTQTDSGFQSALSAALSATLQEFGINPNQVTLSITPATSSTPAASATPVASTAPAASTAAPAVSPFAAAATENAEATSAAAAATTPAASTTSDTTSPAASSVSGDQSFDQAYWAAQPPAVQALQSMDYNERTAAASQLAAQGYKIDVPIMVWGWDPAKVTEARQSYGYTWVPSANQSNIAEAPGVSLPGMTAYNANNPPAGSIAV